MAPNKRARSSRMRRPIDKANKNIVLTNAVTQQTVDLLDARTYPGTVTGLRWEFVFGPPAATNVGLSWAIVVVKDAAAPAASSLSLSNDAAIYQPEQMMLAGGIIDVQSTDNSLHISGKTKSMRKLMVGDILQFITKASQASGIITGNLQCFYKC